MNQGKIGIEAGDGLGASSSLLAEMLTPILGLPSKLEDGHRLSGDYASLVVTSDVFSVDPIVFPGGDIGSLAACGAINDLAASGARLMYCTLGIYASAELERSLLQRCLSSFADLVRAEGAAVVGGDTKVHPELSPELILFVTAIGRSVSSSSFDLDATEVGDDIYVTGPLGDHSIAVLSAREGLGFESVVRSDAHPLAGPVLELAERELVHSVRDLTRGGLVAALWDAFGATGLTYGIRREDIPVGERTRAAAEMLGLDVLALTNEGCMLIIAPAINREHVLEVLRRHPETERAKVIGAVGSPSTVGPVVLADGEDAQVLPLPRGLGVPRLC